MSALLEIKNVSRFFGGLKANEDVTFSVEPGAIVGLIGPNGAGKTTLFNCLTGFFAPSRGQILFNQISIGGWSPDKICKAGMVRTWQKVKPLAKLSVLDNVTVGALCHLHSVPAARQHAREQLELVGLGGRANDLAGGLPIGERKKLEVARVLATRPRLVLFDEVMGGLNAAESEELIELILAIKQRGLTQIVIEHDMKAIMRISDRVVVLNAGKKLAEGTPPEVVRDPRVIEAYLGVSDAGD